MAKILVLGSKGAVGSYLVKELEIRKHAVFCADISHSPLSHYQRVDVGQYRQLERLFEYEKYDYVYHLAAEFGRRNGEEYFETLWQTNVIGCRNVLELQKKHNFKLVFFSSSEIYGDLDYEFLSEDLPQKTPIFPKNDYAISKWVNELQIQNFTQLHQTQTVIVRLFNTYGPGEYFSEYRSVVCQFIYKALHDLPYTVFLNHTRSSTYIDDTIRTLANISENFCPGEVYNICGDDYHDIKMLSDLILKLLKKNDDKVIYKELDFHNVKHKRGDNNKAKKDLGFVTSVHLEEGIRRTIQWQKEIYKV